TPWHAPYHLQYGVAVPQKRLWRWKAKYKQYLRAIAFHEVFALDWLIRTNSSWLRSVGEYVTRSNAFDPLILEDFVAWGNVTGTEVWWSDPYWAGGQRE